ncbi:MAG: SDR family oxidoreductase, partial [bacterium]
MNAHSVSIPAFHGSDARAHAELNTDPIAPIMPRKLPLHMETNRRSASVAVVCGACGGIGQATATRLRERGYRLALVDTRSADLETLRDSLGGGSAEVIALPCSITDSRQVEDAFSRIDQHFGRIDAVINAAGVFSYTPVERLTDAEWQRTVSVNLTGTFFICRAAVPLLRREHSGHIINVLSIAAVNAFANQAAYCASKAGALALTRVLAQELRPLGIRVSSVSPGAVDTPLWDAVEAPFDRAAILRP